MHRCFLVFVHLFCASFTETGFERSRASKGERGEGKVDLEQEGIAWVVRAGTCRGVKQGPVQASLLNSPG